ncbi:MAG: B-box zinc finger protein [Anaerolineae bacterium]|jgi:hypothetical protein|nr:B-box zinc finger protein [Anaerolineae bacterium]
MSDMTDESMTYCAVHPDRETGLRCNKCGRYMCAQCAVSTSVGYRCRECVRQVDDKFFTGTGNDNLIAGAVVGGGAGVLVFLGALTGIALFWLAAFFIGIIAGGALAEAAFRAVQKRRGRYTPIVVAVAALVGGFGGAFLAGRPFAIGIFVLIGIIAVLAYRRFEYK